MYTFNIIFLHPETTFAVYFKKLAYTAKNLEFISVCIINFKAKVP